MTYVTWSCYDALVFGFAARSTNVSTHSLHCNTLKKMARGACIRRQSMQSMSLRKLFPATTWLVHAAIGRIARRVCTAILFVLIVLSAVFHIHAYILTRRFQAVLTALATIKIDETTEAEVVQRVPYLVRGKWDRQISRTRETGDVDTGLQHYYYVQFSNKDSWMKFWHGYGRQIPFGMNADGTTGSLLSLADLLGYRFINFNAGITLLNGKVSSLWYGAGNHLIFPEQLGNVVSVTSFHSRWAPYRLSHPVTAIEDENPAFLAYSWEGRLKVLYAPEVAPALRADLFKFNLTCFWGLFACRDARQVSPELVQDKDATDAATLARLRSIDPCPERIVAGRARYRPDVSAVLLSSAGSNEVNVSEEGTRGGEIQTHYKLVRVLRGYVPDTWQTVKSSQVVYDPLHPGEVMGNNGLQQTKPGDQVIMFFGADSCRVVAATPSALAAYENTPLAPRRIEDEITLGLQ
jgi:hypothetical protein